MRFLRIAFTTLVLCCFLAPVFSQEQEDASARTAAAELIKEGKYDDALTRLAPLIEKNPNDAFLLRLQGYSLMKTGKNHHAIAVLRKATSAAPQDSAAHFFLGNALAADGKASEATTSFIKVVEIDPKSKYAEAVKQLLPQLKKMVEAEATTANPPADSTQQYETVEILVPIPPSPEELLLAEALADVADQNFETALPKIETLLKKFPDNFELQKLKAFVLSETGDADEAIAFLYELKSAHPKDAGLRLILAQTLSKDGQLKLSATELEELIALGDTSTLAASEELLTQVNAGLKVIHKDQWTIYSTLSVEYDTNPAAIPVVGGGQGGESWKTTASLHIAYEIIDQDRDEMPFSWVVSGTGYQSFHDNQALRRLDVTNGSVGSYLKHECSFLDRPLTLTVGTEWGKMFLGSNEYFRYTNGYANANWRLLDNAGLTTSYRYAHEEYAADTAFPGLFSLDGDIHTGSIGGYAFLLDGKALITANYAYSAADRLGTQFASDAHSANTAIRFYLPWEMQLVASVGFTTEDYELFLPQPARLDNVWRYSIALEKELPVEGLKAVLSYSKTVADSNQGFFNYDREIFGLSLRYEY